MRYSLLIGLIGFFYGCICVESNGFVGNKLVFLHHKRIIDQKKKISTLTIPQSRENAIERLDQLFIDEESIPCKKLAIMHDSDQERVFTTILQSALKRLTPPAHSSDKIKLVSSENGRILLFLKRFMVWRVYGFIPSHSILSTAKGDEIATTVTFVTPNHSKKAPMMKIYVVLTWNRTSKNLLLG